MNAQHRIFTGSSLVLVLWPKQHIPNELDVDKWSVKKIGKNAMANAVEVCLDYTATNHINLNHNLLDFILHQDVFYFRIVT
jgi:predicted nicotinamide N-methyase